MKPYWEGTRTGHLTQTGKGIFPITEHYDQYIKWVSWQEAESKADPLCFSSSHQPLALWRNSPSSLGLTLLIP